MTTRRRRAGALRYCHFDDWTCPTALYLVEKGNRPNLWLIARPALIASQENAETVTVTIPEADGEELVYEQVVLSGDQDGVMGNDCLFQHLEDQVESPYTVQILLANCPANLRFGPMEVTLSPNGGGGRMGSEAGSDQTGAEASTRQLLEQLLKEQERLSDVVTKQQTQLSAMQPSTGGPGVLDDTMHQRPAGNV